MKKEERWLLEEKYGGVRSEAFEADLRRLASGEPAAYVIGWQPFFGIKIHLDSRPLIPRPETEWWTERLLSKCAQRAIRFLDLCTGSGAIGCAALAQLPHARVYFGEIDARHQSTIKKNISENNLDSSRADIRIGNLFAPFDTLQFDVIAVNPPYIPLKRDLPKSVREYEPALALFGGKDGLMVIRKIAKELARRLAKGGEAWIECDDAHAERALILIRREGLTADILKDQYGKKRVIVVSLH